MLLSRGRYGKNNFWWNTCINRHWKSNGSSIANIVIVIVVVVVVVCAVVVVVVVVAVVVVP